jgi:hypothetical protein
METCCALDRSRNRKLAEAAAAGFAEGSVNLLAIGFGEHHQACGKNSALRQPGALPILLSTTWLNSGDCASSRFRASSNSSQTKQIGVESPSAIRWLSETSDSRPAFSG